MKHRQKCILELQRFMRGYLARKQHRPRYRGIAKIHKLRENSVKTIEIAAGLKNKDSQNAIMQEVNCINEQIFNAIIGIKVLHYIHDTIYSNSFNSFDSFVISRINQRLRPEKSIQFTQILWPI